MATMAPKNIAHRGGFEKYDQNTAKAWSYAYGHTNYLEGDVRFTLDNVPVIFHDASLDALTDGEGDIEDLPLSVVRAARYDLHGGKIPTLQEFVAYAQARTNLKLVLETKSDFTADHWLIFDEHLAPIKNRVILYSSDGARILEAKRRGYKTALIEWESTRSPASARQYGEYYIRAYKYVTKKQVLRYVNSGLKVIITTPNKPKLWKKYSNMGVWGIMHNKPRAYDKWRKA